ncbi:hypothetical protein Q427_09400 [Halomonas sp. BC04]|nr:hypothetical protein Q427_09400 [Halomonas sp. BC04]
MSHLEIQAGMMTLAQARQVFEAPLAVSLPASADEAIQQAVDCVNRVVAEDRTVYGINTGFGLLAQTRIDKENLEELQRSLVLSHATGVGAPMEDALVRLIMVLKVNSLARGFSGIRREVLDALLALVNAEVYPHIPLKAPSVPPATWRPWPI